MWPNCEATLSTRTCTIIKWQMNQKFKIQSKESHLKQTLLDCYPFGPFSMVILLFVMGYETFEIQSQSAFNESQLYWLLATGYLLLLHSIPCSLVPCSLFYYRFKDTFSGVKSSSNKLLCILYVLLEDYNSKKKKNCNKKWCGKMIIFISSNCCWTEFRLNFVFFVEKCRTNQYMCRQ